MDNGHNFLDLNFPNQLLVQDPLFPVPTSRIWIGELWNEGPPMNVYLIRFRSDSYHPVTYFHLIIINCGF